MPLEVPFQIYETVVQTPNSQKLGYEVHMGVTIIALCKRLFSLTVPHVAGAIIVQVKVSFESNSELKQLF